MPRLSPSLPTDVLGFEELRLQNKKVGNEVFLLFGKETSFRDAHSAISIHTLGMKPSSASQLSYSSMLPCRILNFHPIHVSLNFLQSSDGKLVTERLLVYEYHIDPRSLL